MRLCTPCHTIVHLAPTEASTSLPLPAVLTAPIRLDVVQQVHSQLCALAQIQGSAETLLQRALPRTSVRRTPSPRRLATRPVPSRGVLAVPSPVSPVSVVEVLTAPARCVQQSIGREALPEPVL